MSSKPSPAPYNPSIRRVILKEAIGMKSWIALLFAVICLTVLGVGTLYPKKFTAVITLDVEQKPASEQLVPGQEALVDKSERLRVVKEAIKSPQLLRELLLSLPEETSEGMDVKQGIRKLSQSIEVSETENNKIRIAYSSPDRSESYNNLVKLVELFVDGSEKSRKQKARDIYEFAKNQANDYKKQLREAEIEIHKYNTKDLDGTPVEVKKRIADYRAEVKKATLTIDSQQARVASLEKQISREKKYRDKPDISETLLAQLSDTQSRLDSLRSTYTEDYPDVIGLKRKIASLKEELQRVTSPGYVPEPQTHSIEDLNPVYETLRKRIASEYAELIAKKKLLERTNTLIAEDLKRLDRIAEKQVSLAELSRDYEETKSVYQEMLARKEKARVSLKKGGEGGTSYRVYESARFPSGPDGLRFSQFFIAGPLLGILIPLLLLAGYIRFDPRIRTAKTLERCAGVPVLGVVPHLSTPLTKRVMRSDVILLSVFLGIVLVAYLSIAYAYQEGML